MKLIKIAKFNHLLAKSCFVCYKNIKFKENFDNPRYYIL